MLIKHKKYFSEIYCLAGVGNKGVGKVFLFFLIVGLLDLIGLGLIGQYVALVLGVLPASPITVTISQFGIGVVGLFLVLVFAAKAVLGVWANRCVFNISAKIESNLRLELLRRYQAMSYEAWSLRNTSEYINAINVWVPQYARLVLMSLLRLSAEMLVAAMIIAYLFYINPYAFAFLFVLVAGMALAYDRVLRKQNKIYADQFRAVSATVITDVRQAMDGIKEIRVLGAEKFFSDRIAANSLVLCSSQAKSNTISNSARYFLEFSVVLFAVLVPFLGPKLGESTINMVPILAVFGAGALRLVTLLSLTNVALTQAGFYRQIVHSLYKDLTQPISFGDGGGSIKKSKGFERIVATGLTFKYSGASSPTLSNIDIEIRKGEKVVLLGPSGSGKSTLVDLLLGILQPESGTIKVVDSSENLIAESAAPFSVYLPQSTFLIDDTVKRNIALGEHDSQIDEERIKQVLKRTHLVEVVESMPLGIETEIGDRGIRLSGGQRQRLAIARAIYLGRTVLFLDEATSAIDPKTEEAILDDLLVTSSDLTVIVITHRVEVAHRFDRVLCLRNKKVVELVAGEFQD